MLLTFREGIDLKTKLFAIVLCLSFAILIAGSGTIMLHVCAAQSYNAGGYTAAGSLYSYVLSPGTMYIPQASGLAGDPLGHIGAGAVMIWTVGTSPSTPGNNDINNSWGMQAARYYSPEPFFNKFIGLGNYTQGLRFRSMNSSVSALGFPISNSGIYKPSLHSAGLPDSGLILPKPNAVRFATDYYRGDWANAAYDPLQAAWQTNLQVQMQYFAQKPWQNLWLNPLFVRVVDNEDFKRIATVELDAGNDEGSVTVAVGETIGITLKSNVSTGYSWDLDANQLDPNIIIKVSDQYYQGESDLIGAPGYEEWIFKAQAIGETTIKLDYKRPWEATIVDIFWIDVTVEE